MAKCEICGKGPRFGNRVSHSKKATKRRWLPNIQRVTVVRNGVRQRLYICTKCLKAMYKG